jgi:selenocysteine lyase/cysteine desulfurase
VLAIRGRVWLRLAAQVYNDEADFERLADAVDAWPA